MERDEIVKLATQAAVEQYKVETGRLFSIDQVADMLNVSRSTMYNKMRAGEIESMEVFGRKKFSMAAIEACKKKAHSW